MNNKQMPTSVAKFTWELLPIIALLIISLLIQALFPASFMKGVVLPICPTAWCFIFYASFAIIFVAVLFSLVIALAFIWSFVFGSVIESQRMLIIVQGKYPDHAPIRLLGEFAVKTLHGRN